MRGLQVFSGAAIAGVLLAGCTAQAATPLPVHVGGRVIRASDGSLTFGWPAVYFESRFRGTGFSLELSTRTERMRLLVDGVEKALLIQPGTTSMTVSDLPSGDHIVRLEKLTESQTGGGRFVGFYPAAGSTPLPAPTYTRSIEFIGDSYSVGYGNLSPVMACSRQEVHDRTDSQQAFGPLVAKDLSADYRINAYSGRGVVRNYDGAAPGESLPVLYSRAKPDDAAPAAPDDWRPQVIVINLGTNDFSTPLHKSEAWANDAALRTDYRARYIAFARGLLAKQPQAHLILMGSDAFYADVQQVAAAINRDAPDKAVTLPFGTLERTGCDYHPSLNDHRILAASLRALIAQHPDYWTTR